MVNKTSFWFDKVYGFVCLLIFQSGTSSRIFCFSARRALHTRRPGWPGVVLRIQEGATHAKARMAGSRVAHSGGRYTREGQDGREFLQFDYGGQL